MGSEGRQITDTLVASLGGDKGARGKLIELLYDDLHELAAAQMRKERPDHTLQPTALLHQAYLRLIDQDRIDVRGRSHFLGIAATTMRRVLVDHARKHLARKRGQGSRAKTLDVEIALQWDDPAEVLALDETLSRLEQKQSRQAKVVELRFFAGLSLDETASALEVSRDTVKLDWRFARAWLNRELTRGDHP